jgi:hypothetical protein
MTSPEARRPICRTLFEGKDARRLFVLLGAALLLAAWWMSRRVVGYEFLALGDDDINVTLNPYLGHLSSDRWVWLFTDSSYVRRYMPLGWMTLFGTFQVNGLDPFWYHAASFLFYIANIALVYAVVAHAVRVFSYDASYGLRRWPVFASFLCASWWALHPLRVESTAWISGVLYGQAAFFALCATLAYLRSYMNADRPARRLLWTGVSFVAITASLLTYPIALGFAFLLLALDWCFRLIYRRERVVSFGRLALEKLIFLVPVGAILAVTAHARMQNPAIWGSVPDFVQFPLFQRLMQASYIIGYYVWRSLYPLRMAPITSALLDFNPWAPVFLVSLAAIIAVLAYAIRVRRMRPWVGAFCGAYLASVIPFVGFTEHPHYAADRYAYLPTIVMASSLAVALGDIISRRWRYRWSVGILAVVVVLSATTNRVLGIWADPRTMFTYLVGSIPEGEEHDRILSRFALLEYLYGNSDDARAKIEQCVRDFPLSTEIRKVQAQIEDPTGRLAPEGERLPIAFMHSQLGLYFLKEHQSFEAAEQLRMALCLDNTLFQTDYNLALLEANEALPREALHHLLLAQAHGGSRLTASQDRVGMKLIQNAARLSGDRALDQAVDRWLGLGK